MSAANWFGDRSHRADLDDDSDGCTNAEGQRTKRYAPAAAHLLSEWIESNIRLLEGVSALPKDLNLEPLAATYAQRRCVGGCHDPLAQHNGR